jgi:hypothetical protein
MVVTAMASSFRLFGDCRVKVIVHEFKQRGRRLEVDRTELQHCAVVSNASAERVDN